MSKGLEWIIGFMLGFILMTLFINHCHARNLGQWENSDPDTKAWYESLKQPDNPNVSCCGEGDAYWADEVHVIDGKTYVTITDTREDKPLGRQHVETGTIIPVPDHKLTYKDGNPTGHNVVFLVFSSLYVLCFVQSTGI